MLLKVVSGGQTGVDRAALDVAIKLNIEHGGWCPKGRLAELGTTIPKYYLLKETFTSEFSERTKLNIRDSDGTLILVPSLPLTVTDGTLLTIDEVQGKNKPFMIIDLSKPHDNQQILNWVKENNINVLNIGGPRESQSPGIYEKGTTVLENLLAYLLKHENGNSAHGNELGAAKIISKL